MLPALHALTECDITSKTCSKKAPLKFADTDITENLKTFGKTVINIDLIITAKSFLVKCIDSKANSENFDKLRMEYYHHNNKFNLEKIPPTSASIQKHIQRAFLQSNIWCNLCFRGIQFKNPLDYRYIFLNEKLIPDFETEVTEGDFCSPHSSQKCAGDNASPYRKRKIPCCEFYKCQRNSSCKNPKNVGWSKSKMKTKFSNLSLDQLFLVNIILPRKGAKGNELSWYFTVQEFNWYTSESK